MAHTTEDNKKVSQGHFKNVPDGFIALDDHLIKVSNITRIMSYKGHSTIHFMGKSDSLQVMRVTTQEIAKLLSQTQYSV